MNRLLALAILVALLSCGQSEPSLVGTWSGVHPEGGANAFTFRDDGTATWKFENPDLGSYEFTYTIDYSVEPHHVMFTAFDHGPLEAVTFFGILEFNTSDQFRLDLEPGTADDVPDDIRPTEFTDETQTYTRLDAGERVSQARD
jgi:hypothetical protein